MTVTVAVFDIDGVVADVRHRLHLIEGRRRDWVRFHESAVYDPALVEGITLVATWPGNTRLPGYPAARSGCGR